MKNIIKTIRNLFKNHTCAQNENSATAPKAQTPLEIADTELNGLWDKARKHDEDNSSEPITKEDISASFERLSGLLSSEQFDENYVWVRFLKLAVRYLDEPVDALIGYVDKSNYIVLSKRLSDLIVHETKKKREECVSRLNDFATLFCQHILSDIDPNDSLACIRFGNMAQDRGDYETARAWFERIIGTDKSVYGMTSLLSSYERETRELIAKQKDEELFDPKHNEKIEELNRSQEFCYEKWRRALEDQIKASEGPCKQAKATYVVLMAGYGRLERYRGNYERSFTLLQRVPEDYPDIHRIYTEQAMLFQNNPSRNRYYSLKRAEKMFRKAAEAIEGSPEGSNVKSKKCILVPLANTYFQMHMYDKAAEVCDQVLKLDSKEHRAIALKEQIMRQAS